MWPTSYIHTTYTKNFLKVFFFFFWHFVFPICLSKDDLIQGLVTEAIEIALYLNF